MSTIREMRNSNGLPSLANDHTGFFIHPGHDEKSWMNVKDLFYSRPQTRSSTNAHGVGFPLSAQRASRLSTYARPDPEPIQSGLPRNAFLRVPQACSRVLVPVQQSHRHLPRKDRSQRESFRQDWGAWSGP